MKSSNKTPKVSVVMTTFNKKSNVAETLLSISEQTYTNIEIVIQDGCSTDGTLDVIEEFNKKGMSIDCISEPDSGIYDAMNKGFLRTQGDIIVFFNDKFSTSHAIEIMVSAIQNNPNCIGAHADLVYMSNGKIRRYWKMGNGCIKSGWMPGHPTLFLKREIFERYGLFDTSFICSADYEFMIRFLKDNKNVLIYVPEKIVEMYYGGTSTNGLEGYLVSLKEGHAALVKNRIRFAWWIDVQRTIRVLWQFVSYSRN